MENFMDLKIVMAVDQQTICKTMQIDRSANIAVLKQLIKDCFNIPEDTQVLKFNYNGGLVEIYPGQTLNEFNLQGGEEIHLSTTQKIDLDKISTVEPAKKTEQEETKENTKTYHEDTNTDSTDSDNSAEKEVESSRGSHTVKDRISLARDIAPRDAELLHEEITTKKSQSVKKFFDDIAKSTTEAPEVRVKIMIDEILPNGWNSLHTAISLGLQGVVRELLERNADVNRVTLDGWSPLQIAISHDQDLICKMLLEVQENNINTITPQGTALHIAASKNNRKIAQILLFHDADLTIRDHDGKLPSEVTTDKGISEMLQVSAKHLNTKKVLHVKEEVMPPKPTAVKGWLWKLGPFMNHKKRYFVLDPNQFTFSHYMNELEYPKKPRKIVPLLEIKNVKKINSGWMMKKEYFYFELTYEGKNRMFASKTEETQCQWIDFLRQAIAYAAYVDTKIKQHLYYIQDLEEVIPNPKKLHSTYFMKVDHSIELLDQTESERKQMQIKAEEERALIAPCEKDSAFYVQDFDFPNGTESCLEDFDAISKIGNGAFGTVYKVKRRSDGKIFAIKTLKKRALLMRNQMKSAISEMNILKKANNPFVLQLEYAFQTRDHLYLCLEYCSGGDLASVIEEREKLNEDLTRMIAAEMIVIVDYLHSIDVLYRDMKPDNILIDEDGHIKITDFGLSKLNIGRDQSSKSFCGSPAYLSPEMLKRQGATWATDVYGIGTVIFELLTGEPPYYSHDITTIYDNMKKGKLSYPKILSPNAKDLLIKMLEQDPAKRLGVADKGEIMRHPFFASIDWDKACRKQYPGPFAK